jgi:hypothetical protein
MNLTAEQLEAVKRGQPLRFSAADAEFVVLRADQYEAVKALLGRGEDFDPREAYPAIDKVFGEDWDDPKMAEYDNYEDHKR